MDAGIAGAGCLLCCILCSAWESSANRTAWSGKVYPGTWWAEHPRPTTKSQKNNAILDGDAMLPVYPEPPRMWLRHLFAESNHPWESVPDPFARQFLQGHQPPTPEQLESVLIQTAQTVSKPLQTPKAPTRSSPANREHLPDETGVGTLRIVFGGGRFFLSSKQVSSWGASNPMCSRWPAGRRVRDRREWVRSFRVFRREPLTTRRALIELIPQRRSVGNGFRIPTNHNGAPTIAVRRTWEWD